MNTGSLNPSVAASVNRLQGDWSADPTPWSNPGYAKQTGDGQAATSLTLDSPQVGTDYLRVTDFGFASMIPAGAVITGVSFSIARWSSDADGVEDDRVYLVVNNTPVGSNHAKEGAWPIASEYETYGGENAMWGWPLQLSDINSGFGVQVSAGPLNGFVTPSIDHISGVVYYTLGGGFGAGRRISCFKIPGFASNRLNFRR